MYIMIMARTYIYWSKLQLILPFSPFGDLVKHVDEKFLAFVHKLSIRGSLSLNSFPFSCNSITVPVLYNLNIHWKKIKVSYPNTPFYCASVVN